jgi:hypothetical protein
VSRVRVVLAVTLAAAAVLASAWALEGTEDVRAASSASASSSTTYSVSFHETGLSKQTWGVSVGSSTESTNGQGGWPVFPTPNGTYPYTVYAPSGFMATPSSGSITVSGHNPPYVAVTFSTAPTYTVGFHETGLSNQTWSVTMNWVTQSTDSSGGWIVFQESNGTHPYSISAPWDFTASPSSGTVTVSGHNPPYLPLAFSPAPLYPLAFEETGISGLSWSVVLTQGPYSSTVDSNSTSIAFQEPNGTYDYTVYSPAGYSARPGSGMTTVAGGTTPSVPVSFAPYATLPTSIQHVVVIMLENTNLNTALADSPYLHYLWNTYGQATEFYAVCHGSYPNYVSITNGRYVACGGTVPETNSSNLPDVLQAKTLNWGGYFESMPSPCYPYWYDNLYDSGHNPFLVSKDIVDNASRCDAHVVNSAAFNSSVAAGYLPAFSFYGPNFKDDCENSSLAFCSAWLQGFLSPVINSTVPAVRQLMQHTAFFIAFDEGLDYEGYSVGDLVNSYCQNETGTPLTVCGGHTYLAVVSPYSHGTAYTSNATDYSIESTIEWLLGVGSDGGYDSNPNFPAMTNLFT